MRILQKTPHPALRPYVECFWSLEGPVSRGPGFPRIPPFGELELAFYRSEPFRYRQPGAELARAPRAHVTGPRTSYLDLVPGEIADVVSVRFRPGAFHCFCPGATAHLSGEIVSLTEIWGHSARRLIERLFSTGGWEDQILVLEDFLLSRLRKRAPLIEFIPHAIQAIQSSLVPDVEPAIPPVDGLARNLNMSRRTFQRRFREAFGLGPQEYRNLLRFESTVKDTLGRFGAVSLTDQALKFGYYDQSHFIRDFQKYIGRAPGDFFRNDGRIIQKMI